MRFTRGQRYFLYFLFSLSGGCALIYEILWTRHLSLLFGTTIYAVSIVAASFMGGLALGGYLIGRYADRKANLLKIYAAIEIGIAAMAFLLPHAIDLAGELHVAFEFFIPDYQLLIHISRLFFCAALLAPPTILIGGTFPLMCRLFAREKCGGQIGRLYAMNTLGAVAGTFLAGYVLIPQLGMNLTGGIAMAGNISVAVGAFVLARGRGGVLPSEAEPPAVTQLKFRNHRLVLFATAMIGFFALAYEILWTRVFLLYLGNTTYAFSLILCTFLIGIALGGALYARHVHRAMDERKIFIRLSGLMGLVILATAPCYDYLAYVFQWAHTFSGENWTVLTLLSLLIVFTVMFIPTIISGALLPAAVAIIDPGKLRIGSGVGLVVLCNTLGAVAGSIAAGFVMVPALGLLNSFRLLALLNIALTFFLLIKYSADSRRSILYPVIVVTLAVAISVPLKWDQKLMNAGVYVYAHRYAREGGIDRVLAQERLLDVIEGVETTVAVFESLDQEHRFFTVNGKTDGGTGRDIATQLLVGQLPLLLHPDPTQVMVIGLGTGITLRGMSDHPTHSIYCAEISPEVVAAEKYFREQNDAALKNPKITLAIVDGRERLMVSERTFDVITSQPSNPWQTGNANLFTADFYRLAATRLKPGGIFCQWIGLYDITPKNLKIALNTFLGTFGHTLAFRSGTDLILVGATSSISFDYLSIKKRLENPRIAATLRLIDITSPGDLLASHFLCSAESLRSFTSTTRQINTDNLPVLEFSAKDTLYLAATGKLQMANINALLEHMESVSLPLGNLGANNQIIARSLRDIARSFSKVGRDSYASKFMQMARSIESK